MHWAFSFVHTVPYWAVAIATVSLLVPSVLVDWYKLTDRFRRKTIDSLLILDLWVETARCVIAVLSLVAHAAYAWVDWASPGDQVSLAGAIIHHAAAVVLLWAVWLFVPNAVETWDHWRRRRLSAQFAGEDAS